MVKSFNHPAFNLFLGTLLLFVRCQAQTSRCKDDPSGCKKVDTSNIGTTKEEYFQGIIGTDPQDGTFVNLVGPNLRTALTSRLEGTNDTQADIIGSEECTIFEACTQVENAFNRAEAQSLIEAVLSVLTQRK